MGLRAGGPGRFGTTGLTLGDSGAFGLAPPNRGGAPTPGRFGTTGATGGAFATGASISISVSKSGSSSIAASGALSSSATVASRSEEHTSELQSHSDLVCRLLLEKKKK